MTLGPIQTQWIANLRAYPERQTDHCLGEETKDSYCACCLGELLLTKCRYEGKELPFDSSGDLYDIDPDNETSRELALLISSYKELGLHTEHGRIVTHRKVFIGKTTPLSLVDANDNGATWPEIADFVEANPGLVFTRSV
jgi:hypothetical protein